MDVVTILRELKSAVDAQIEMWKVSQGIIVSSYDSLITSIKGFITGYCDAKIIELKNKSGAEPPEEFIDIINNSLRLTMGTINDKNSVIGNYTYSGSNIMYFHHGIGNKVCEGAFNNCSMLFAVYMPDLVACTNAYAIFNGCSSLMNITFPDGSLASVTNAYAMFSGCSSLTNITFPEGSLASVTTIERLLASCSSLTSVTFPNGSLSKVSNMHDAFNGCSKITSITFPNGSLSGVKNVRSAFSSCNSLTSITFPDGSLLSVDNAETMFYNCSSLKSITLPYSNAFSPIIFSRIFCGCKNLTDINGTIDCRNATYVVNMFNDCALSVEKCKEIIDTINWSIIIGSQGLYSYNTNSIDGEFNHPETESLKYASEMFMSSRVTSVNIDFSNLTNSSASIFYNCKSLTGVTLNGGIGDVTSVYRLFYGCSLLTTIIGLSLKSVNASVSEMFTGCSALTDCKYDGTLYVTGIDLSPCTNLSAESLYSWVSALYDWKTNSEGKTTTSTSHVLTLSESQIESLRSYTGDNGERGESAYVLALEKGWDITS